MATATVKPDKPAKAPASPPASQPENVVIGKPASESQPASKPDSLQGAVSAETERRPAPVSHATIADDVMETRRAFILNGLASLISTHTAQLVAHYNARGLKVWDLTNLEISRAVSEKDRKDRSTAALRQAELTAFNVYDSSVESQPAPSRWLSLAGLVSVCADAVSLPSVKVALVFATQIQRVETPDSWGAPLAFVWKAGRADAVRSLISRAILERWTEKQAQTAVDALSGLVIGETSKKVDPIKGAESAARALAERFNDGKVDPETFFDVMAKIMERYGYIKAL